jgi:hypothetical protein
MKHIWCTKKGIAHGFQNELVACVACVCKKRKDCKPYAAIPLTEIARANKEAKASGYQVSEDLPLFESMLK